MFSVTILLNFIIKLSVLNDLFLISRIDNMGWDESKVDYGAKLHDNLDPQKVLIDHYNIVVAIKVKIR